MKRVSLKDIATELNLSKTTVSFILNGKGKENNISRETIKRVLETAKRLNYHPNYLAKSLSIGKSNTIGLIVPHITDPFFAQVATVLEKKAQEKGFTVVYGSTEEMPSRERNLINTFLGKQVDGFIIASTLHNETEITDLQTQHYPLVLIDRVYPQIDTNYVGVENEKASYEIVSRLISKNRRNIALVTVSSHLNPMTERAKGYQRALAAQNLHFDESMIKEVVLHDIENSLRQIINRILNSSEKIDAIYFTTHYLAALGFKYLKAKHVSIPEDIAICCFGDSPYLEILTPSITAIPMPAEQIGQEATRILFNNLSHGCSQTEHVVLPVKPIERQSC